MPAESHWAARNVCQSRNYSQFATQRAERQLHLQRAHQAQQEAIARTEAFIRRYRAGQRARQARGRQKQLDRLVRVARPRDTGQLKLAIQSTLRSGDTVLATEDLAVAVGHRSLQAPGGEADRVAPKMPVVRAAPAGGPAKPAKPAGILFQCPDIELQRGDRAAVIGPNGSGKTTFLRVITGEIEPAAGRVYVGHGVQLAYYAQAHEQLHLNTTVLAEILAAKPMGDAEARTYLGRFLFTGDDVFKRVSSLSGGERSRLAIAKLALGNANFLVLDEPTNHLDIYAREALEDVLTSFTGTILFVSHDRYLIEALATQVWEVAGSRLAIHKGSWTDYLEARQRQRAERAARGAVTREATATKGAAPATATGTQSKTPVRPVRSKAQATVQREQLQRVEVEMASLQTELRSLQTELEAASAEADGVRIGMLGERHEATTSALARLEDEWLAVREALDQVGTPLDATSPAGYRSA